MTYVVLLAIIGAIAVAMVACVAAALCVDLLVARRNGASSAHWRDD